MFQQQSHLIDPSIVELRRDDVTPKGTAVLHQHPRIVYTLAAERQRDLLVQAQRAHLRQLARRAPRRPPKRLEDLRAP